MKPNALFAANGKLYMVRADTLVEVSDDWTTRDLGPVGGGDLSWAANETQLCVVAAPNAYVLDYATGNLSGVTGNWRQVVTIDGFGVFVEEGTAQFFASANQDFTIVDALSFASTESTAGPNVAALVKHREIVFLKGATGEVWYDSGAADFPFARNDGAPLEIGCAASKTLKKVNGVAYWLGRDDQGQAVVFAMSGYVPQRVSSHALEEAISGLDLAESYAWTYHQEGLSFYVLNVPGLDSTWVYEVASGTWHERAEIVDGVFTPWRAVCHAAFAGVHVCGDADDNVYTLDPTYSRNGTDELVRDLITPHTASASLSRERVGSLQLDCDVAQSLTTEAHILMRYSDDGGRTWSNWKFGSLGDVGRTKHRVRWTMLGAARDRVWQFRVTDDVQCNLISAVINER